MPKGIPKNGINSGRFKKGFHPSIATEFKKGQPRPKNANSFPKGNKFAVGNGAHLWKGGWFKDKWGYIYLYLPKHPNASRNYIAEHRVVMEKFLGRYLGSKEGVHHINGVKHDNRIENLAIIGRANHYGKVVCPFCQADFLIK